VFSYETAAALPGDASGTWRVGLEARRAVTLPDDTPTPGGSVSLQQAIQNPVLDFSVDGSPVLARREVVADASCATCHGTFSQGFSVHGGLRNRVDYCVICHNPNASDFARRRNAVASGADPLNEPIVLKHLLHKIHRGEELSRKPYVVYGFGAAGFTPHDFSEVLFPGDLRDCEGCHVGGSQALPLPSGLLPTAITEVDTSGPSPVEVVIGSVPPIQDACLSCHDSDAAAAHAETNTTTGGAEACTVCHGEGSSQAVTTVHVLDP
jgi:OmcA/MtrC family decaheme c-type cytochrome